jgi:malate dehydrogenase
MPEPAKCAAITRTADPIACSLLLRIARGDLPGNDQPVILQPLERSQPTTCCVFRMQALALDDVASGDVKVCAIGNPPNANAWLRPPHTPTEAG